MSKRINLPDTMTEKNKRAIYPEVYAKGGKVIIEKYWEEKYGVHEKIKIIYDHEGN